MNSSTIHIIRIHLYGLYNDVFAIENREDFQHYICSPVANSTLDHFSAGPSMLFGQGRRMWIPSSHRRWAFTWQNRVASIDRSRMNMRRLRDPSVQPQFKMVVCLEAGEPYRHDIFQPGLSRNKSHDPRKPGRPFWCPSTCLSIRDMGILKPLTPTSDLAARIIWIASFHWSWTRTSYGMCNVRRNSTEQKPKSFLQAVEIFCPIPHDFAPTGDSSVLYRILLSHWFSKMGKYHNWPRFHIHSHIPCCSQRSPASNQTLVL